MGLFAQKMELDIRRKEKHGNNYNVEFFRELTRGKKEFLSLN